MKSKAVSKTFFVCLFVGLATWRAASHPLAVAVVLDTSGSAIEADMQKARNAVVDLVNRLRPQDKLAIFTFDETGTKQLRDFSSTVKDIKPLLKKVKRQGDTPDALDCLLEITQRGAHPITLPTGEERRFLLDGDEVILRGWCERAGFRRIGLGECRGIVLPVAS